MTMSKIYFFNYLYNNQTCLTTTKHLYLRPPVFLNHNHYFILELLINPGANTVEPPSKGHYGISHFVLCREVILFSRRLKMGKGALKSVLCWEVVLHRRLHCNNKGAAWVEEERKTQSITLIILYNTILFSYYKNSFIINVNTKWYF